MLFATTLCQACHRPVIRLQRSGPRGTATGDQGPVIAYPCNCWLDPAAARAVVSGRWAA